MPRPPIIVVGLAVAAVAGVAAFDALAHQLITIEPGSVNVEPQTDLEALPTDPTCPEPIEPEPACTRRYAYRPGAELTVWFSVRNAGPLAVTMTGVSSAWLAQFDEPMLLAAPRDALDGGDPGAGVPELRRVPLAPAVLQPGAERLVGLVFRTTENLDDACSRWEDGSGVEWSSVAMAGRDA